MTRKKSRCIAWEGELLKIKVRYFAAFREATGIETEVLETTAVSPAELFSECGLRHESLQNYSASLVAINDEMADWETAIRDGDEVLFFPPVAGG
jgi:molybdopterin converting factor small subunit